MSFASGLYSGVVTHARTKPRAHRLAYRVFFLLLDLDELGRLDWKLGLFSHGGLNLVSVREKDHGDGSDTPLKAQVEAELAAAGIAHGGPVRMLTMPRVLGHGFNPLTVYFCHRKDGTLSAILYEVTNTFGERHAYLIPAGDEPVVRQCCAKDFYVSPFMDMDLAYGFRIRPPGETVRVQVEAHDAEGLVLAASFLGRRTPLSDAGLLRAWLTHPWMSLGVLTAIHWEALRMWLRGEKLRPKPAPPARRVTVVDQAQLAA
ncbi:DUF1365 domain-containing protein [Phenylobacterium sp.]|uniref:DUF1365 domain-containing protein n=1 Tax=Phenylobacterium sp. TaxID=1871053 RepID=UPI002C22CE59|nr:DUF1365 family protein [Phenylobacterium sp.]HVI32312.1 DUF1365 family protein [Phenylobacterium sp.]